MLFRSAALVRDFIAAADSWLRPSGMAAFHTADRRKTFEKLKAKGVEFVSEPKDQFYGVEAVFKDPFGNWFSLTQPKNY